MAAIGKVTVPVVAESYSGDEARTILAQARAYKRIAYWVLNGTADRDPAKFRDEVRHIMFEAAQEGA